MGAIEARLNEHPATAEQGLSHGKQDALFQLSYEKGQIINGIRVNNAGFVGNTYDEDIPPGYLDKPAGVRRVIVFGNSSLASNASTNSGLIPAQLQEYLNARNAGGSRWQVFNFGAGGASSYYQFLRLINWGLYLEPDVVVFIGGFNEFMYSTLEKERQGTEHPIINWADYSYSLSRISCVDRKKGPWIFTYTYLNFRSLMNIRQRLACDNVLTQHNLYELSGKVSAENPYMARTYRNNVAAAAGAVAAEPGIRMLWYLQPQAYTDRTLTPNEEAAVAHWHSKNVNVGPGWHDRQSFTARIREAFDAYAEELKSVSDQYAHEPRLRFIDLRSLFKDVAEDVYPDIVHYNEFGNGVIAKRFAADILSILDLPTEASSAQK